MTKNRIPLTDCEFRNLMNKARISSCRYRISAVAFDKKGDILGYSSNSHSSWNVLKKNKTGRSGTGVHAERELMKRYKGLIKTIVICRIGHGGDILPIEPCDVCKRVANKYGIKIISVC